MVAPRRILKEGIPHPKEVDWRTTPAWCASGQSGTIVMEIAMVALIEDKRDSVAALCRKHGVVNLFVFGSAARDDFRPGESDVDLLVDFGSMDGHSKVHAYFALLDELQELFGTRVDLVMVGALKNRYIARDVEATKQLLYAA
jgi:uncharacterized protein